MRVYLCPHCEAQLTESGEFCSQCGAQISWPDTVKAVTAVSSQPVVEQQSVEERPPELSRIAPPLVVPHYEASTMAPEASSVPLPIPENIAAVIAYMTPIPAVIFLYLEPFRRNVFVRFHAFQHIVLWCVAIAFAIVAFVLWMVLQLIPFMRVLVFPFAGLIGLGWFFLWLLLVVKAYHHEMFKLPYIGDFVEEWSLS